jgi:alpha-D-ribose 1-methylphosphonate 5-triphosphate diphosphatase
MTDAQVARRFAELRERRERLRGPQRRWLLERVVHRGLPLASHDDDPAEMDRNKRDGVTISEFPVLMEAARPARAIGVEVIAGAPDVVRGGSHSGNVGAADLVRESATDALASDYVPGAVIEAAWCCATEIGLSLPEAAAMVTDAPARMARLHNRGRIAPGLRAGLVRVRVREDLPVVRQVWRAGERVS